MTPLEIVEHYTNQPIKAGCIGKTLQAAMTDLLGEMGLAILVKDSDTRSSLAYVIDHTGTEHLPMPGNLQSQPMHHGCVNNIALNDWRPCIELDFSGVRVLQPVFCSPQSIARISWKLGGFFQFDLLLLPGPDQLYHGPVSENLQIVINFIATSIVRRAEHSELQEAENWIESEIQEIAKIQELLQPESLETIKGAQFAVHSEAYRYAGGDYYDISNLTHRLDESDRSPESDMFSIAVADVSGHGPSAVVELGMLDAILRTYGDSRDIETRERGPHSAITYLNRHMFTRKPRAAFVTGFFCLYRPAERTLLHSCAGHPPPIWIHAADGSAEELPVSDDIPIRILRDYEWSMVETPMLPGDMIVIYTDGVTECKNEYMEQLGVQQMLQICKQDTSGNPAGLLENILEKVHEFVNGKTVEDDQTIVIAQFL